MVGSGTAERDLADLNPWLLALAAVSILSGFAVSARVERQTILSELVERHVQGQIVDVVTTVELEAFDRPSFYDRLQRARTLTAERSWQIVSGVAYLTSGAVGLVALSGVLISVQPAVLPIMALACVPLGLAMRRNSRAAYQSPTA